MKKVVALGGIVLLASCGGGSGTSSVSEETYKLATVSQAQEVETSPVVATDAVTSITGISSSSSSTKGGGVSSKGIAPTILEKIGRVDTTRDLISIPCDNGNSLEAYVVYDTVDGVSQPQSCSDIKDITINIYNIKGEDCQLGDYVIDGNQRFTMRVTLSNFSDDTCLEKNASMMVEGLVKHLDANGTVDEAYLYNNLSLAFFNINWVNDEISNADYKLTGGLSYFLGDYPVNTDAELEYQFAIAGRGNETTDTFSGYIKLGCLDGWLKVQTTKPLEYSGDEILDGEVTLWAQNGDIVISYSPNGVDVTQTLNGQTETYHYNSAEEIKENLKGIVCTAEE
ncbi:hypothetical protein Theam_0012 [Thermovibrio ammonificans HB-1]|uniref:Lipoprotein n=1 Tax=Thermovibrio ammonificans (strain DSM 15698 / JCM 12110 / HB-1) TaxID=648996 RepID=E8T2R1_THEA1|nr:hypothetical protein [Thermovibrio ammonificans]ADU95986.1 hypothetical protein Theam_0012 [Thermovibrio ammonificans HB-1]